MAASLLKTAIKNFPCLFFIFVTLYAVAVYLTTRDSYAARDARFRFFDSVCTRFETAGQLSDFIWSHRGHHPKHEVDGSVAAQRALLEEYVYNFDVDVSHTDGIFYVAHPSTIQRLNTAQLRQSELQTVDDFLTVLGQVTPPWASNATTIMSPFVTLEPKFPDPDLWKQLIKKLALGIGKLPPSHTAVVVNEPSQLRLLEDFYTSDSVGNTIRLGDRVGAAIAYRSLPKTPSDFSFTKDLQPMESKDSNSALAPGLCCAMREHSKALRHVYMPDVQLVKTIPYFRFRPHPTTSRGSSRGERRSGASAKSSVMVPWLVDTEAGVLEALDQHVSGVVSNEAPALLALLRARFEEQC